MANPLSYPFDPALILRKRAALRAKLAARAALVDVRVALLGGSTTSTLKELLELFLLSSGIRPTFYECEFGKYEEEVLFDDRAICNFAPQIAVVHTTWCNARFPPLLASEGEVTSQVASEVARFESIWTKLAQLGCTVVQNNFDMPPARSLGNLDASKPFGRAAFLRRVNVEMARATERFPRLVINDIDRLSAQVGLDAWFDASNWYSYKLAVSPEATVPLAHNVAAIIGAAFGRSRKCLVLDLDNTLWGGVIGDDGVAGIRLGRETPEGEAYTAFQEYCLELRKRGVLLAVCSKNEPSNAREGFAHPDSVLALTDFAAFNASWNPKHDGLVEISHELNLGLDSFVFVDDNPAEREIVRAQLPMVAVPEMGSDPSRYVEILDRQLYFETLSLSQDDIERTGFYATNVQRNLERGLFANYGEFLDSLAMKAEIAPFHPMYMERIAQLTNKSNQFNLTTRRYTESELDSFRQDPERITLYGRLADKFGDNGLVTVVVGRLVDAEVHVDLWLMSCRVLKRDMEHAMLDELVRRAKELGARRVRGTYAPTAKNGLVAKHYEKLGFALAGEQDGSTEWVLDLNAPYEPRNTHIKEILRG